MQRTAFLRWLRECQCFPIAAATFCPSVSEWLQALKCAIRLINMTWMSGAEAQALEASRDEFRSSASFRIWKMCRSRSRCARWKGAKPSLIFWYLCSFEVANFCSKFNDLWILRYSLEAAQLRHDLLEYFIQLVPNLCWHILWRPFRSEHLWASPLPATASLEPNRACAIAWADVCNNHGTMS